MSNIIININNILAEYLTPKDLSEYKKIINDEKTVKKQYQKIKDDSKPQFDDWYYYLAKIDLLIAYARKKLKKDRFLQMLFHMGKVALQSAHYDEAEKFIVNLITEIKNSSSFQDLKTSAYLNLSEIYLRYGYWDKCSKHINMARRIFIKENNTSGINECDRLIGIVNLQRGNLVASEVQFEENLLRIVPQGNNRSLADLENDIAVLNTIQGNFDKALVLYKKSLGRWKKIGDIGQVAIVFHNVGMLYTNKEENESALYYFNKSIKLLIKHSNLTMLGASYYQKAYVLTRMNRFVKANFYLEKALEIFSQLNDRLLTGEVYKIKGIIERELKNYQSAESYFLSSLRINREFGNELNLAETNYELGILFNVTGRVTESKKAFISAYKYFEKNGVRHMVKKIKATLDLNTLIISLKTKKMYIIILSTSPIMIEGMKSFLEQSIFSENVNILSCPEFCENKLKNANLLCLNCMFSGSTKWNIEKDSEVLLLIDDYGFSALPDNKNSGEQINYKTIIYTNNNSAQYLQHLLSRGINGVVHKTSPRMNLLTAIENVISGSVYIDPLWMQRTGETIHQLQSPGAENNKMQNLPGDNYSIFNLSKRERELLLLIAEGKKNKPIADILSISSSTVETHKANILKKLNLSSTTDLVIFAATYKGQILKSPGNF